MARQQREVPTPSLTTREGNITHDRRQAGSSARDAGGPAHPNLRLGPEQIALAQSLIDELSRVHSLAHCALFLWDPAVGRLRLAAQHWGAGEDLGEVLVGAWTVGLHGVCGRAFTTATAVLVPDVEDDSSFLSFPGSRTRSELAAPVVLDGNAIGVVNVESQRVRAYSPADVATLTAWAESVGEALRPCYS